MKIVSKLRLFIGLFILLFLLVSYFIHIDVETGLNYIVNDPLLGIIIFHNFFVFALYLLIATFFVITGFKRLRFV